MKTDLGIIELAIDSTLLNTVNDLMKILASLEEALFRDAGEQESIGLLGLTSQISELIKSIEKSMDHRERKGDVHGTPVHQKLLQKIREIKLRLPSM